MKRSLNYFIVYTVIFIFVSGRIGSTSSNSSCSSSEYTGEVIPHPPGIYIIIWVPVQPYYKYTLYSQLSLCQKLKVFLHGRSDTSGLWPLVVQFLLWEAESNGHAQWIWVPAEVSWTPAVVFLCLNCSAGIHAGCFCVAGLAPTQWQMVRWPASLARLWWRGIWVRAVTLGRSRVHPCPHKAHFIQESPRAGAGNGGSAFFFSFFLFFFLVKTGCFIRHAI